jgi:hypothetical protein
MKKTTIKTTNKEIMDIVSSPVLMKLRGTETQPAKAEYIRACLRGVNEAREKLAEGHTAIIKKFCVLDEKGEMQMDPKQPGTYQIAEGKADEATAAMKEFYETERELRLTTLDSVILSDFKLSAEDIENLGPLYGAVGGPGVPLQVASGKD